MNNNCVITIDDINLITEIERLQYEVETHKDLLAYLINTNTPYNEAFKKYDEEYKRFFMEYQKAKHQLELKYIFPAFENQKVLSWNLDFASQQVTVTL